MKLNGCNKNSFGLKFNPELKKYFLNHRRYLATTATQKAKDSFERNVLELKSLLPDATLCLTKPDCLLTDNGYLVSQQLLLLMREKTPLKLNNATAVVMNLPRYYEFIPLNIERLLSDMKSINEKFKKM